MKIGSAPISNQIPMYRIKLTGALDKLDELEHQQFEMIARITEGMIRPLDYFQDVCHVVQGNPIAYMNRLIALNILVVDHWKKPA